MSKLKNILIALEKQDREIHEPFNNAWDGEYDLSTVYPYIYMIEQIIYSFEQEFFDKKDLDNIAEKELLEGVDENAAIENLVYFLYTQVKLSKCGPDPTSRYIGNYLVSLFVTAALLWLTEGEDEFNGMKESWEEHCYDVVGSLEIAHLVDEDEYYTKMDLLAAIEETMKEALEDWSRPDALQIYMKKYGKLK